MTTDAAAGQSAAFDLFATAQVIASSPGSWQVSACPSGLAGITIDWGDGSTSTPSPAAALSNGALPLSGQHTYSQAGQFPVTVSSVDSGCAAESLAQTVQTSTTSIGSFVVVTFTSHNLERTVVTLTARVAAAAAGVSAEGSPTTAATKCKKKKKKKKRSAAAAKKKKKKCKKKKKTKR